MKDQFMLWIALILALGLLAVVWVIYIVLYIPLKLFRKNPEDIFVFDPIDQRID